MNKKKIRQKLCTITLILLFFVSITVIFNNNDITQIDYQSSESPLNDSPKSSAGEISLITPENKDYQSADNGYYPATFGFESDKIGTIPRGWVDNNTPANSEVSVVESQIGHNKVVYLKDRDTHSSTGRVNFASHFAEDKSEGEMEFWMQSSDVTPVTLFYLQERDGTALAAFGLDNEVIKYYTSSEYISGNSYDNTWYHFYIAWDSIAEKWNFTVRGSSGSVIDEQINLDFQRSGTPGRVLFITGGSFQYDAYVDAIGYSWDTHYSIGDNLKEGLLLSYDNNTNLDWQGYSLDGATNKTIYGNTTLKTPYPGSHTIQVFGNDSSNNKYSSELRSFSVNGSLFIHTPEQKTYYEALNGYYPGTYGFESDKNGLNVRNWIDSSGLAGNYIEVIEDFNGHRKVLHIEDAESHASQGRTHVQQFFEEPKTKGTIEWWLACGDATPVTYFGLRNDISGAWPLDYRIQSEFLAYNNGGTYQNIMSITDNVWYHFSVEFDCATDLWNYSIHDDSGILLDSQQNINFADDHLNATEFFFWTGGSYTYDNYIDAMGYSWDPNYSLGDNFNEGLLLSYSNSTNLDWQGYSLDEAVNKTIYGNTTIPIPSDGTHTIQVFANDTEGLELQSNIRSFSVNMDGPSLNIITPINKSYTESDSGYYPATYGFENDKMGTNPQDWLFFEDYGEIQVIENQGSHNKVVDLYDTSTTFEVWMDYVFSNKQNATIEWWWQISTTDPLVFLLSDGASNNAAVIRFDQNQIRYYTGTEYIKVCDASADQWYHVRLDFNCSDYTFNLCIDNEVLLEGLSFVSNIDYVSRLRFSTMGLQQNYHCYVDSVGFSWDSDYTVGDNYNEGLLLSYENSTNLDWQGYSLDGAANQTIYGNTTIPMPSDGSHTIQLFANNTLGQNVQSEIRYFTVKTLDTTGYHPLMSGSTPPFIINDCGIYIDIICSLPGYLYASRHEQHDQSAILGNKLTSHYYYNFTLFTVYNSEMTENNTILQSATIRLYYEDNQIENEDDLTVLHLVYDGDGVLIWDDLDVSINKDQNYIEFTTNEFSSFCLAELKKTDAVEEAGFWVFFMDNLFMIVILAAIGITIPSAYAIRSKRKKKKEDEIQTIDEKKIQELVSKAQKKREHMMDYTNPKELKIKARKAPREFPHKRKKSVSDGKKLKKDINFTAVLETPQDQNKRLKELEKTEKEMAIEKDEDICQVHRGPIEGVNYSCPKCKTKYCLKCAQILKKQEEHCWVCNTPIKLDLIGTENKEDETFNTDEIQYNLEKIVLGEADQIGSLQSKDMNITALSKNFINIVDQLEWEGDEKDTFINEMLALTPKERQEILHEMIEYQKNNLKND